MSYESHVENLAKKVSKRLGLLKHISPYLKKHHERHSILALSSPPSCMVAWFGTAVILNVIKDSSNEGGYRIIPDAEKENTVDRTF